MKNKQTHKTPQTPTLNFRSFCMVQQMGTKAVHIYVSSTEQLELERTHKDH